MVEAANKDRCIGSQNAVHGHAGVFQGMIHILKDQSLLGVQSQELILGDVEKWPVEECRIFTDEMPSLDVRL